MNKSQFALELSGIYAGEPQAYLFDNLIFALGVGEIHAIVGARAYDLTNMIDLLSGSIEGATGELRIAGRPVPIGQRPKRELAYVMRRNALFGHFSIARNMFVHARTSRKRTEQLARRQMEHFGLGIDLDRPVDQLTSGEQKVIEILRGYNSEASILVMHDTLNYIEKRFTRRVPSIFEKLTEGGKSILYLTSNLDNALLVADRISLLDRGKIDGVYRTEEVRADPRKIIYQLSGLEGGHSAEQNVQVLETIMQARDVLTSSYQLKSTLSFIAENVAKALSASSCIIYVNDNQTVLDSVDEEDERALASRLTLAAMRGLKGDLMILRASDDPMSFHQYFLHENAIHTFVVAAVKLRDRTIGYIQVSYEQEFSFSKLEELYLSAFTKEVAMAIETSRLMGRSVLLQESHHRIKNNLQVTINLLYMQRAHINKGGATDFLAVINDIISRIKSIAVVHDMLSGNESASSIINLRLLVEKIVKFYNMRDIQLTVDFEDISIPYNKATSISLVINELIGNCMKHAFQNLPDAEKRIHLSGALTGDRITIVVADNGEGIPEDFDMESSGSLGLQIIHIIVGELQGTVRFLQREGTWAEVSLPTDKIFETWDTGFGG